MPLQSVLRVLVAVELVALGVAVAFVVGPRRIRAVRGEVLGRLTSALPHLLALGLVLALNSVARTLGPDISWMIGWNVTPYIHRVDGAFVPWLQSHATPPPTAFFSAAYVYGYVFLLVFPVFAYFLHDDDGWLRRLVTAYGVNYAVGLVCYVLFVSYGPRNVMPGAVDSLLYTTQPSVQLLTTEVNTNTNVFPSLHASLSTTVALLAYHTRSTYPRWLYLATPLAVSVSVSTMYLGIHWATDVVAGMALAFASVHAARRLVPEAGDEGPGVGRFEPARWLRWPR